MASLATRTPHSFAEASMPHFAAVDASCRDMLAPRSLPIETSVTNTVVPNDMCLQTTAPGDLHYRNLRFLAELTQCRSTVVAR
jgi:hypothetical protein